MGTCFDYSRCTRDFKVYLYPPSPTDDSSQPVITLNYAKIISVLNHSSWLTNNPEEACLFIPRLDTLNRDILGQGFDATIQQKLTQLPYWYHLPRIPGLPADTANPATAHGRTGRNHLLFNFYSGTWPHYNEDQLSMLTGEAIIAKASASTAKMRSKFDISIPLFGDEHPERHTMRANYRTAPSPLSTSFSRAVVRRPVLLSFKGKRYVVGFGSTTRNALFHLNNNRDIIMLTTCRHGSNWMRYADARCPSDMELYDRYDYNELLANSTFCLVPRGRRLGSYRFLEVLQAFCIPVLLSNDFELPFSEVIDWREVVIWGDERLIFLLPLMLRRISDSEIIQRRQRIAFLWFTYFHSVEAVVRTTIEIIHDRVASQPRSYTVWNSPPGAFVFSQQFSTDECLLPLPKLPKSCANLIDSGFTVIIPIRYHLCSGYEDRLKRFSHSTFKAPSIRKILIVWMCDQPIPTTDYLSKFIPKLLIECIVEDEYRRTYFRQYRAHSPHLRFQPFLEIPTLAVFAFTLDFDVTAEQLEFAYSIWREYPHRLVSFQTSSHYWDPILNRWQMLNGTNQKQTGVYSIGELTTAFYHRYYHHLYWELLDESLHNVVNTMSECEDILMNILIAHLTRSPPIKVAHPADHLPSDLTYKPYERSICLQTFSKKLTQFSTTMIWPSSFEFDLDSSVIQNTHSGPIYLPLYKSSLHYYQSEDQRTKSEVD